MLYCFICVCCFSNNVTAYIWVEIKLLMVFNLTLICYCCFSNNVTAYILVRHAIYLTLKTPDVVSPISSLRRFWLKLILVEINLLISVQSDFNMHCCFSNNVTACIMGWGSHNNDCCICFICVCCFSNILTAYILDATRKLLAVKDVRCCFFNNLTA